MASSAADWFLHVTLESDSDDEFPSESEPESDDDFCTGIEEQWEVAPPARRVAGKTSDPYVRPPQKRRRRALARRASDVAGEFMGINGLELRRLLRMAVPIAFLNIMCSLLRHDLVERDLGCVEYFAGRARIHEAFVAEGYDAASFEVFWTDSMNFNDVFGFINAIMLTLRLRPRALQWFATVCSTWVWVSRGTTWRSQDAPEGPKTLRHRTSRVKEANMQVSRMMLLACVAASRRSRWALEQPATSLMTSTSVIRSFRRLPRGILGGKFRQTYTDMGAFDAMTKKPSKLFSIGSWMKPLKRTISANFIKRAVTCKKSADGSVTGVKSALKETQDYTKEFGIAVFDTWSKAFAPAADLFDPEDSDDSDWETLSTPAAKVFDDAFLGPIARLLNVPVNKLMCR